MPGTFSVGGLASGLDTENILAQLREIERRPITLLQNRRSQYEDKLSAWESVTSKLTSLQSAMDELRTSNAFNLFTTNTEDDDYITLSATSSASPGEHNVVINSLAQARKITSKSFTSKTEDLNLSGDFLIDGNVISVGTTDSLQDIVDTINNSNADVNASILQLGDEEYRMIIAAESEGEDSFHILDASTSDVLQSLGILNGTTSIKNSISGGAESDTFADISTTVGGLLNLSSPQSGTVTINDASVTIDLANDTLTDIRDAINSANPTSVVASIESTTEDNTTVYKLRIEGTTSFTDDNNVLQTLGVLESQAGFSAIAQVVTGDDANTTDGSTAITSSTTFGDIYGASVSNGDTIDIAGIDHDGSSVSSSFTITDVNSTTIGELLTEIESAFSNNVTATVNASGKIVVTDDVSGESQLDVNLIEQNEGGGSLDFGTFSVSTNGQDAVSGDVQSAQDASITVDGVDMTRGTNSITDIIEGVTLNLHKADATKTLDVSVNRDYDTIKENVQSFVEKYNEIINFINTQFTYNEDTEEAGTLLGDSTLVSIQNEIRNIISNRISGLPEDLRSLAQVGISSDRYGVLSFDQDEFTEQIQDDFDGVLKVFAAVAETSDSDISYVYHNKDTNAGTYSINVTQAATQASVTGSTDLSTGISGDEVLTITDTSTSQSASITLNSGQDIESIVSEINYELSQEYQEKQTSSGTILTSGSPATSSTTWADVDDGGNVGDTFTISGTTHSGDSVSGTYTIESGDTVQNLLTQIQSVFDDTVTATINDSGNIVITDIDSGTSQMDVTITANNEGGGTLDLGTMSVTQTGRYDIAVTASNENGYLKLTYDDYGSSDGFSVSQDTNNTGITDGSYSGQDVAGTINGETATGSGQNLSIDNDDSNIDGLVVRVNLTPTQLTAQGSDQGTLTLTLGAAEQMYNHIETITDQYSGYVALREDNIQDTIDHIDDRIETVERRVNKRISNLEQKFIDLEKALAQMNSLNSYLTSQLSGLSGF